MATGDVVETKRVRSENNLRLDNVDFSAIGDLQIAREQMIIKALIGGLSPYCQLWSHHWDNSPRWNYYGWRYHCNNGSRIVCRH